MTSENNPGQTRPKPEVVECEARPFDLNAHKRAPAPAQRRGLSAMQWAGIGAATALLVFSRIPRQLLLALAGIAAAWWWINRRDRSPRN